MGYFQHIEPPIRDNWDNRRGDPRYPERTGFIAEALVQNAIRQVFLAHPEAVNESYAEHAGVAFRYAGQLLLAGCAALVHAFIPALFEKTASSMIRQMCREMDARASGSDH
jgi:hypothetical protein